jgi:hypothetical protein
MNVPGFTAEAALYRTSQAYQVAAVWSGEANGQVGLAQFGGAPEGCRSYCNPCRPDPESETGFSRLCITAECEEVRYPCQPPSPQFPTPWVCELDPVSRMLTAPCCRICHRMLSPNIGQTLHTC